MNIACLFTQVKGSWFFFFFLNKGTSYVGLGLTLIASFYLDYHFKGPVSKYSYTGA